MLSSELLTNLFLNISLLVITAMVLTEFPVTRTLLLRQRSQLHHALTLALVFGVLACLCTCCGLPVQGAIANTRVVSVAAAGLLGGPVAGIGAGLIGGLHRYWYDPYSFTALGCCVGTIWFGVVGAAARGLFAKARDRRLILVLVVIVAELCQVVWLVLLSRPLSAVWHLEVVILLPKILMNSLGMILFFGVFDRMRQSHMDELVQYQTQALYIADRCLPYLRHGLEDAENLATVAEIIRDNAAGYQVALTGQDRVLAASGMDLTDDILPDCAIRCMQSGRTEAQPQGQQRGHRLWDSHKGQWDDAVAAPLRQGDAVVGSLVLAVEQGGLPIAKTDLQLTQSLAQFFSTILELSNLEHQIELRHQAEFRAFQAQINPHFFYNALNTISALCRTDPDEARLLLVTLANYYRHTLSVNEELVTLEDELQNVENYLTIVRARFEDAVHVECSWPREAAGFRLPPLIIQPLVENAVRHGKTSVQERHVRLEIAQRGDRLCFAISDRGHGFPPEVLAALKDPHNKKYSGLFNVSKRLLSIYGPQGGLQVQSSPQGSTVSFSLPLVSQQELQNAKEVLV